MLNILGTALENMLLASWEIMLASSPFILLGFFVAGLLKGFIPADFIERHLGGDKKAGIVKAALLGVPLPL